MDEFKVAGSINDAFKINKPNKKEKNSSCITEKYKKESNISSIVYEKISNKFIKNYEKIQEKFFSRVIEDLIEFVINCENDLTISKTLLIPTGIISIGSDSLDFKFIYNKFNEQLIKKDSSYKTIFFSSNGFNNIGTLKTKIFDTFLTEEILKKENLIGKDLSILSYQAFLNIYERNYDLKRPNILIFEEFSNFDSELIKQIIFVLKSYLTKFPVIILISLSNTFITLQFLIEVSVIKYLLVQSFESKNSLDILDEGFNEIFLDLDYNFILSSKCINYIKSFFIYYDFSIDKVISLILKCLFEHCYFNEYSYLCEDETEFKKKINNLSEDELMRLKKLKSVENFNFNKNLKEDFIFLYKTQKNDFKNLVDELSMSFKFFYLISDELIFKSFHNFYIVFTNEDNKNQEFFEIINQNLMKLSKEKWIKRIENFNESESKLFIILKEQLKNLVNLESINDISIEENIKADKKNFKNRHEFLIENSKKVIKSKEDKLGNWKKKTIELIENYFLSIKTPEDFYLKEIFYFDDLSKIKKNDLISIRESLLEYLKNPTEFMKKINNNQNIKPDICIAFETFKGSANKINIVDWLNTFKSFCSKNNDSSKKSTRYKKKKVIIDEDTKIDSRFFSTLMDFELLNFLEKGSSKSNDFATKLIYF